MSDLLTAPSEANFSQEGATLITALTGQVLSPLNVVPIVAPESFKSSSLPVGVASLC